MNKKADVGLGVILVILILVLALGWIVNEGYKDCHNDSDCADNQYCTSGFECKDVPQAKASPNQNIISDSAAWVVGLSLIAAAVIIKWETFFPFLNKKKKDKKKPEKDKDGYVDLSKSHNAEDKGLYDDFLNDKF